MRLKLKNTYLLIVTMFSLLSCNYMDEIPYDWVQPEDVFSMENNYIRPVNQAYSYLPSGYNRVSNSFLDAATDDAISTISNSAVHLLARGFFNSNTPVLNPWNSSYMGIRQTHFVQHYLKEVDLVLNNQTPQQVQDLKNLYAGEMYALRAFYEFDLLRHYGGYVIVDKYYEFGDSELTNKGRNTFEECVNNIVSLCDSASKYLNVQPIGNNSGRGRMTKGTALAIKAKTLVFAASPLFNQQGNTNAILGYTQVSNDAVNRRWEYAASACADVINLKNDAGASRYTLYVAGGAAAYANSFTVVPNNIDNDFIFYLMTPQNNALERRHYPPSLALNSGGGTVPTQDLVDAFTNANGTDYVKNVSESQYTNRDPRFANIITFNGSKYRNNTITIYTKIGEGSTIDGLNMTLDRSTNTGYYLRKFLNLNINFSNNPTNVNHIFPVIRFSDILLLYAEAMNEAYGPDVDPNAYGLTAKAAVQMVRNRAGFNNTDQFLANVNDSETMRAKIKQERRIELCFEEQRYFDLRRWMDGDVLNKPINGVRIETVSNVDVYTEFEVDPLRKFERKMYLHPIPLSEIRSSPNIVQNPGW